MGSYRKCVMTGFICRLCSEHKNVVIHIYSKRAMEMALLRKITTLPISIRKFDKLPKTICENCIEHLCQQFDLIQNIKKNVENRLHHSFLHSNGRCPTGCPYSSLPTITPIVTTMTRPEEPDTWNPGSPDSTLYDPNIHGPLESQEDMSSQEDSYLDNSNEASEEDEIIEGSEDEEELFEEDGEEGPVDEENEDVVVIEDSEEELFENSQEIEVIENSQEIEVIEDSDDCPDGEDGEEMRSHDSEDNIHISDSNLVVRRPKRGRTYRFSW